MTSKHRRVDPSVILHRNFVWFGLLLNVLLGFLSFISIDFSLIVGKQFNNLPIELATTLLQTFEVVVSIDALFCFHQ